MASNPEDKGVNEGIPLMDADGKQRRYFNTTKGKIENMPPRQRMSFDTKSGKLMMVSSNDAVGSLDNRVFTEIDESGFFNLSLFTLHKNKVRYIFKASVRIDWLVTT